MWYMVCSCIANPFSHSFVVMVTSFKAFYMITSNNFHSPCYGGQWYSNILEAIITSNLFVNLETFVNLIRSSHGYTFCLNNFNPFLIILLKFISVY